METKYPDLSDTKLIVVDIETFDPNLLGNGTGVYRDDGYILGVSISTDTGFSEYYNLGHWSREGDTKGDRYYVNKFKGKPKTYRYSHYEIDTRERRRNINYLKQTLGTNVPKLGTNYKYDLDWLQNWLGIPVNGEWNDVQIAEPLIDENQGTYNLDFLGKKYLNIGKFKTEVDDFCERHGLKGDPRKWLYLMPYELVRGYAIADVDLPRDIFKMQMRILEEQNLVDLYRLEMKLYPLLLQMRKVGVRINTDGLDYVKSETLRKLEENKQRLYNVTGRYIEVNYNTSSELAFILDKFNIDYPMTEKTHKPSITKPWLMNHIDEHPVFEIINNCRKYHKLNSTFLESQIGSSVVDGRIHCSFNQLRGDEYGTVSGRFSSSNPNLQFIPANDPDIGKTIRALFIPEEDHEWIKADYSQVEARIIAHYAMGPGADELRQRYIGSDGTDLHQWCADLTGVTRKYAKRINFGLFYGMGVSKLCVQLGMNEHEGKEFMKMYHSKLPFIRNTIKKVSNKALARGYVKTMLGRHRRFPDGQRTYKALNSIVQGTAADIMKKAMVDCNEAGLFNILTPHITVHDELDVSKPMTTEGHEAVIEMKNIMENCVKLKVPIIADVERGPNWGDLQDYE